METVRWKGDIDGPDKTLCPDFALPDGTELPLRDIELAGTVRDRIRSHARLRILHYVDPTLIPLYAFGSARYRVYSTNAATQRYFQAFVGRPLGLFVAVAGDDYPRPEVHDYLVISVDASCNQLWANVVEQSRLEQIQSYTGVKSEPDVPVFVQQTKKSLAIDRLKPRARSMTPFALAASAAARRQSIVQATTTNIAAAAAATNPEKNHTSVNKEKVRRHVQAALRLRDVSSSDHGYKDLYSFAYKTVCFAFRGKLNASLDPGELHNVVETTVDLLTEHAS